MSKLANPSQVDGKYVGTIVKLVFECWPFIRMLKKLNILGKFCLGSLSFGRKDGDVSFPISSGQTCKIVVLNSCSCNYYTDESITLGICMDNPIFVSIFFCCCWRNQKPVSAIGLDRTVFLGPLDKIRGK